MQRTAAIAMLSIALAGLPAQCVTTWSGTAGPFPNNRIDSLTRLANDDVVVGGYFGHGAQISRGITGWDGVAFYPLGNGLPGTVTASAAGKNGEIYAVGGFSSAGGLPASSAAMWDGLAWTPMGSGINAQGRDVCVADDGTVYVVGEFTTAGGSPANLVASWHTGTWSALGSGLDASAYACIVLPNGDLVVGGRFSQAGGQTANHIARWDGSTWHPWSPGLPGHVYDLAVDSMGTIYASSVSWSAGAGTASSTIYRWDEVAWQALGTHAGVTRSIQPLPGGDLVANTGNEVVRWNGSTWREQPGTWYAQAVTYREAGQVVVAGFPMLALGGSRLAFSQTSCVATANELPTPCVGPNGPMTLTTATPPWLGAMFASSVDGLSLPSLAISVIGTTPANVPLAAILPGGVPGCDLLAAPDLLDVHVPVQGVTSLQLQLPTALTLAGIELHHQFVQFDPSTAPWSVSSSNALRLTLGSF